MLLASILANGKMARQARMKATREIKQEGEAEKKADKKRKRAQKLAAQKAKAEAGPNQLGLLHESASLLRGPPHCLPPTRRHRMPLQHPLRAGTQGA